MTVNRFDITTTMAINFCADVRSNQQESRDSRCHGAMRYSHDGMMQWWWHDWRFTTYSELDGSPQWLVELAVHEQNRNVNDHLIAAISLNQAHGKGVYAHKRVSLRQMPL